MSIHLCGRWSLDDACRQYGANRIHLHLKSVHITIALTPGDRSVIGTPPNVKLRWLWVRRRVPMLPERETERDD